MNNPIIIGGDKRSYYLYEIFKNKGYSPLFYGAEKMFSSSLPIKELSQNTKTEKSVILPTPAVKSDGNIFAPYSEEEITSNDLKCFENCTIFGGMIKDNIKDFLSLKNKVIDISNNPVFTLKNAFLTAEGAISIAVQNSERSIFESKVLIIGNGRIGKALAKMLKGYFADITVSARTQKDFDAIYADNNKFINTDSICKNALEFDYIFNTVPYFVIDKKIIKDLKKDCLIIDLASYHGGTDFEECERQKIKALLSLSLPGKCSPYGAAKVIFKEIKKYID